jgi:hypothetical protein
MLIKLNRNDDEDIPVVRFLAPHVRNAVHEKRDI